MKKNTFWIVLLAFIFVLQFSVNSEDKIGSVPVLYKGRIRPLDSSARLWLKEYYNFEKILPEHFTHFKSHSALELFLKIHFLGVSSLENAPFFWIENVELKKALKLNEKTTHFSFKELEHSLFFQKETNIQFLKLLIIDAIQKISHASTENKKSMELTSLSPGLRVKIKKDQVIISALPKDTLWKFLRETSIIVENYSSIKPFVTNVTSESLILLSKLKQFHLMGDLKILPGHSGEWFSLKALKAKASDSTLTSNFTVYSTALFENIRESYLALEKGFLEGKDNHPLIDILANQLLQGYSQLESKPYRIAEGKRLLYPTINQLQAEQLYHRIPFNGILLTLYILAIFLMIFTKRNTFILVFIASAFAVHTVLLVLRCYVLNRPPVSNMEETIIYVPWVSVLTGLLFYIFTKRKCILLATSLAGAILLWILRSSYEYSSLDNVQAVLDSQYWLIVHVMLVVGSYGVFLFGAILGHLYLVLHCYHHPNYGTLLPFISKCLLQTLYVGVAMLIAGTLLGGVWAAESWGRFWDWDPKESWAFISICTYLVWIHAYRFKYIREFPLAIGAIIGWLSISFTWYGVNYILGTGMHSYGFGSGGEKYYYGFLLAEALFLIVISFLRKNQMRVA